MVLLLVLVLKIRVDYRDKCWLIHFPLHAHTRHGPDSPDRRPINMNASQLYGMVFIAAVTRSGARVHVCLSYTCAVFGHLFSHSLYMLVLFI